MILARATIQGLGKPKEYLEKVMKELLEKVKAKYEVVGYSFEKPSLIGKTVYEQLLVVEVRFRGIKEVFEFIMDFGPISMEVLELKLKKVDERELEEALQYVIFKLMDVVNLNRMLVSMYRKLAREKEFLLQLKRSW